MAQPRARTQHVEDIEAKAPVARAPSPVRIASDEAAAPSPARDLQDSLMATWLQRDEAAASEERWSRRKSLAVMVGSSALLWAAIIGGATYILNH